MKKSILTALCVASLIGCVPPNAISDQSPSVTTQPNQTVAAEQSSLRRVGNVLYFLNAPPDRTRPWQFKDQKAIDAYYASMFAAIKKRNPAQDARYAFNNGMRYFFTTNGTFAEGGQRGNPLLLGTPEMSKLCPNATARIVWLESVKFYQNSVECLNASRSCYQYMDFAGSNYILPFNKEMSRLCLGGK